MFCNTQFYLKSEILETVFYAGQNYRQKSQNFGKILEGFSFLPKFIFAVISRLKLKLVNLQSCENLPNLISQQNNKDSNDLRDRERGREI